MPGQSGLHPTFRLVTLTLGDGDPVERRFGSAASELADAADAVIDAVLSCAQDASADTVTVRL